MALTSKPLDQVRADVPVAEVSLTAIANPVASSGTTVQDPLVRINFLVPESLRKELKQMALNENRYLTDILLDAISLYRAKGPRQAHK